MTGHKLQLSLTIFSIIFILMFRFIKTKSPTNTTACFDRSAFGIFDVRTSNIVLQLRPDVVTFNEYKIKKNISFSGIGGKFYMNPNGDRDADFALKDLNPATGEWRVCLIISFIWLKVLSHHTTPVWWASDQGLTPNFHIELARRQNMSI